MKKFKITWTYGMGSEESYTPVIDDDGIVYTKVVDAPSIDLVSIHSVLPNTEKTAPAFGVTLVSDTLRIVDYGSWSKFIRIEEIQGE